MAKTTKLTKAQAAEQQKQIDYINKVTKALATQLTNAMSIQTDVNQYTLQRTQEEKLIVRLVPSSAKILCVSTNLAFNRSFNMLDRAELKAFVDIVANSYYNTVSNSQIIPAKQGDTANQATSKQGATTMPTSVNVPKFQASLIKNGWVLKDGIYTKGDFHIGFTAKQVTLNNDGKQQKLALATTTDQTLAKCIQSLQKGEVLKVTPDKTLTAPVADNGSQREQSPAKRDPVPAQGPTTPGSPDLSALDGLTAPAPKAPPSKPVNPNADGSHPVFDQLQNAVAEVERAEVSVRGAWEPIAAKFGYSVTGLSAALHAEGMWPDKVLKDGSLAEVDGKTVPAGYKGVYEAEKASGIKGAGYLVNTASRMFVRFNPKMGGAAGEKERSEEKKAAKAKAEDKNVDKILLEMSRLAKLLNKADLRSWLDTDPSVIAAMGEDDNDDDLLSGL